MLKCDFVPTLKLSTFLWILIETLFSLFTIILPFFCWSRWFHSLLIAASYRLWLRFVTRSLWCFCCWAWLCFEQFWFVDTTAQRSRVQTRVGVSLLRWLLYRTLIISWSNTLPDYPTASRLTPVWTTLISKCVLPGWRISGGLQWLGDQLKNTLNFKRIINEMMFILTPWSWGKERPHGSNAM